MLNVPLAFALIAVVVITLGEMQEEVARTLILSRSLSSGGYSESS